LKLRRLAREPLVQFLLVGAAIFLLAGWLNGRRPQRRIVVTNGQIDRMIDTFAKTWMRPPTPQELQGLIDGYVKDEIYYREAVKMGLDRDDEVIRRRMRMKMEFWNESAVEARAPTDAELSAFLAEHPDRFRSPERVTFEQVFLREDHGNEAADLLGRLRRGLDPAKAGDPLPLPASMDDAPLDEVSRLFGEEFGVALAEVPAGSWEGPVPSSYGLHLVRIRARTPGAAPELSAVRDAVAREWFAARREEANRGLYETLRRQYTVTVEAWKAPGTPAAGSRP
jgi:hypothetical protein